MGIDWGNPITRGLCFAWSGANPKFEAVSGIQPNTDNTTKVATEKGIASKSSLSQVNTEWAKQFVTTSDGAGTGDFTFVAFANPSAGAGVQHILAQKNDAGGSPFAQTALCANSTASGVSSAGEFALLTFNSTASGVSAVGAVDGKWHLWVGVRRGTSHEIYKDGILLASASATAKNISQASRYTAIGSRGNGTTESFDKNVAMAAGFNRALLPNEISNLNPWKIFAPVSRAIWVPTSSAVVSITRPTSDVTTTGWTGNPDNTTLFNNIDESTASDTDYITSPTIGTSESITFGMSSLAAGTWDVRYRANFVGSSAQVRIHLLDGSNVSQGVSSWQTVTSTFADYTASVTTTGAAVRVKIEVQ